MQLADSNIWLALSLSSHTHHPPVAEWFHDLPATQCAAFCRMTQIALLRLLTTPAVTLPFGSPALSNDQAWQVYEQLLAHPRITFVDEPSGVGVHWQRLACRPSPSPKVWMDAYLAAFALAGGHQLVTIDAALRQFDGLDLVVLDAR